MAFERALVAALLLAGTVNAAEPERFKGWSGSPEFVLLATEDDQVEWKKVATDEEAARFMALFWARRDPDLRTPPNEFKAVFDARVKEADELFTIQASRIRGALTERGKLYILVGQPKGLRRSVGVRPQPSGMDPPNPPGTSLGEQIVTFHYDADFLPAWAEVKTLDARFVVDSTKDFLAGREGGVVMRLEATARKLCIKSPDLTDPPLQTVPAAPAVKPPS